MMKLLLTRLLPAAAAVGIFTTSLSPVKPALAMFAAAADALAGETSVTVDTSGLGEPSPHVGQLAQKVAGKQAATPQKQKRAVLEKLADEHDAPAKPDEEAFGWKPGDRAPKPIGKPKSP